MTQVNEDDKLLSSLLVSLRNTAQSFGEQSQQYHSVRSAVQEHLTSMSAKGLQTQLIATREQHKLDTASMVAQLENFALQ